MDAVSCAIVNGRAISVFAFTFIQIHQNNLKRLATA